MASIVNKSIASSVLYGTYSAIGAAKEPYGLPFPIDQDTPLPKVLLSKILEFSPTMIQWVETANSFYKAHPDLDTQNAIEESAKNRLKMLYPHLLPQAPSRIHKLFYRLFNIRPESAKKILMRAVFNEHFQSLPRGQKQEVRNELAPIRSIKQIIQTNMYRVAFRISYFVSKVLTNEFFHGIVFAALFFATLGTYTFVTLYIIEVPFIMLVDAVFTFCLPLIKKLYEPVQVIILMALIFTLMFSVAAIIYLPVLYFIDRYLNGFVNYFFAKMTAMGVAYQNFHQEACAKYIANEGARCFEILWPHISTPSLLPQALPHLPPRSAMALGPGESPLPRPEIHSAAAGAALICDIPLPHVPLADARSTRGYHYSAATAAAE